MAVTLKFAIMLEVAIFFIPIFIIPELSRFQQSASAKMESARKASVMAVLRRRGARWRSGALIGRPLTRAPFPQLC